jgi:DNA polymerase V
MQAICGLFGISEDYQESFLSLDERFIKDKNSTYFFKAQGDSMSPLIINGDVLVVDRSVTPASESIVIVSWEGEMICKRLRKKNGYWVLSSMNPQFKDIFIRHQEQTVFFGVVTSLVREL